MTLPTSSVLANTGDAKNMGRRKIEIAPIQNERYRQVTFAKRKLGVIRKATELSVLCDTDVAVIIFGQNKKMSVYSSSPMNELVNRYLDNQETADVRSACPALAALASAARLPPLAGAHLPRRGWARACEGLCCPRPARIGRRVRRR